MSWTERALGSGGPAIRFPKRVIDQFADEILPQTLGVRRQLNADRSGQPPLPGVMQPDLQALARLGHFNS